MITIITADDLNTFLQQPGALLFDVRNTDEWKTGHIDGAILLPLAVLPYKVSEHTPNKQTPIAVYCRSGNRSSHAAHLLQQLGYTNIANLEGGFTAFAASKNEVTETLDE